jgi:hypothetical protein
MPTGHPGIAAAREAHMRANVDLRSALARHQETGTEDSAQALRQAEEREDIALAAWEVAAAKYGDAEDQLAVKVSR